LFKPSGAPVPLEGHAQMIGPQLHAELLDEIDADPFG
jgi:hypothetical protein